MQILNISKLRNGIGILKKQENITENLTAEENRKEITETIENAAAEKKPARRPARKNATATKKKTDEAAGKEEKGGKAEKKARAEKKTKSASAETVKVKKSGKNKDGGKDLKQNEHSSKLKIIPLGGLEQIGMNITAFEYEDSIIVVDCGLSFPEDDMYGIDLVIPDITYLKDNIDKVKGFFITHGHEDHIGAIPYVLKEVNAPIYATKLTNGIIEHKLKEHNMLTKVKRKVVKYGQHINLGCFRVEFIKTNHSIQDAAALAIYSPAGIVVHTGDFKVDYTPIDGQLMDFGRIAELGNKGILALMSDSTNAERKGFTMSESSVGELFDTVFQNCSKRIVVATFASNVHRIQQIVNSAIKYNRKIAVCGRSMINIINTSIELGYIKCPDNIFIDIDMIGTYTDEQLVIITTGSQGEPMSALTRMAAGDHRKITITPNDLIIISATPIPGNEKYVSKVIDDLMQLGAEVVYSALANVHVSGHACQEEQKLIMALAKPKYFIPVHGEYRQLRAHADTAKLMGVNQTFLCLQMVEY